MCIIVENEEDIAAFKDFKDDASSETAAPSEVKTLKNVTVYI